MTSYRRRDPLINLVRDRLGEVRGQIAIGSMELPITEDGQLRRLYMAGEYAGLSKALEIVESILHEDEEDENGS